MTSTRKLARLGGLLYLLISIPGFYGLVYVPSSVIVRHDAAATVRNLLASETFFRSGIVADLVGHALFILAALVLYRLLGAVGKTTAALMLILLVVQIPIVFVAEVHRLDALDLLHVGGPVAAFSEAQRNALVMASLSSYDNGLLVDEVFMGLWMFPFAWLIWKSGFLPRVLGVTLFLAGAAYLSESLAWLLVPASAALVSKLASPVRTLELATPLWLLIMGAKNQPVPD